MSCEDFLCLLYVSLLKEENETSKRFCIPCFRQILNSLQTKWFKSHMILISLLEVELKLKVELKLEALDIQRHFLISFFLFLSMKMNSSALSELS